MVNAGALRAACCSCRRSDSRPGAGRRPEGACQSPASSAYEQAERRDFRRRAGPRARWVEGGLSLQPMLSQPAAASFPGGDCPASSWDPAEVPDTSRCPSRGPLPLPAVQSAASLWWRLRGSLFATGRGSHFAACSAASRASSWLPILTRVPSRRSALDLLRVLQEGCSPLTLPSWHQAKPCLQVIQARTAPSRTDSTWRCIHFRTTAAQCCRLCCPTVRHH